MGAYDGVRVGIQGLPYEYDAVREGCSLKVALLEHGLRVKGKTFQVVNKARELRENLALQFPLAEVYQGVSYIGAERSQPLGPAPQAVHFCVRLSDIPQRIHEVWTPKDTAYVSNKSGLSLEGVEQLVYKGVHDHGMFEGISGAFGEFFSERAVNRLLLESWSFLDERVSLGKVKNEIYIHTNAYIGYNGRSVRETDCVLLFWRPTTLCRLLRIAEALTPELHAYVHEELRKR